MRQDVKKAARNQKAKSDVDALTKRVRQAITAKDGAKAADWLKQAIKKIDWAAQRGVIKKTTAARKKSRLSKTVRALDKQ